MDRSLYNYALLKALHDQGSDYIDCFWPFVISVIKAEEALRVSEIQVRLREQLAAEVPLHVTESVIRRACHKGYLRAEKGGRTFRLTKKGFDYRRLQEKQKDVDRRLQALGAAASAYFGGKGHPITVDEVLDLVFTFVQQNRGPVVEFLSPGSDGSLRVSKTSQSAARSELLVAFIHEVDKAHPEHYQTLKDLLLGSLISAVVYARDASQFDTLGHKKFRNCKVYLDTNLLLAILELKEPELNKAALELFNLLKQFEFDVLVLPATVKEVCHLVGMFRTNFIRYPKDMKVDSIYSTLRRKGWKESNAREFVINIEATLEKRGIGVDWRHDYDLQTYQLKDETQRPLLAKYKPGQHELGQTHDLAAIEIIQAIRGRQRRAIEDCKAIFLTSDYHLSRFNFLEFNHRIDATVCEVFFDKLFTNILWLKSPQLALPLTTIISVHSRDLFIDHNVWDRFYGVLQQLHKEKKVDDEGISTLFYHNYIEGVLRIIDNTEIGKITPSFVLSHIQERAKLIDSKLSKEIAIRESEFISNLDREIRQAKATTEDEWFSKIESMKSRLRSGAGITATKCIRYTRWVIAMVFLVILVMLLVRGEWDNFGICLALIEAIGLLLSIAGFTQVGVNAEQKLLELIYRRRLGHSGLDQIGPK